MHEDGAVRINTAINTAGFDKGSKELQQATERLQKKFEAVGRELEKSAVQYQKALASGKDSDIQRFAANLERARDAAAKFRQELGGFGKKEFQTEEYQEIQKHIDDAQKALDKLLDRQDRMRATGVKENSAAWRRLEYDIKQTQIRLQDAQGDLRAYIDAGGEEPFSGTDTAQIDVYADAIARLENTMDDMQVTTKSTSTAFFSFGDSIKRATAAAASFAGRKLKSVLSGIASAAIKSSSAVLLFGRSAKNSGKSVGDSLLTFVKYSIGIRSIYALVRKATTFIKEGLGNLAQYSSSTNAALSGLMSSMTRLKNSFATAFSPILEVIAPALTSLIDTLSRAVTLVGALFAALSGKTTMVRAVAVQQNYAESLGKTAKAAKEAKKQLAGFDELNILTDTSKDNGGGTGGIDPSQMFEEVPVELPEWLQKIKDGLEEMKKVAEKAWEDSSDSLIDAWERAKKTLLGLLGDIARDFLRVFTDGYGYDWLVSLFGLLEAILNVIDAIAGAFRTAWNDNDRGYKYIASIFIMFTAINNLLAAIARTFVEAWNSGIGVEIAKNLLEIWTGINLIVANLADGIRRAWEDTGLGVSIWTSILTIINDVLSAVNQMVQATVDWAAGLDFEPLFAAADKFLKALEPLVAIITGALAWAWENILLPLGEWTIEEALPQLIEMFAAALDVLTAAAKALQPAALWLWENFLQPLAEWTGDLFIRAIQTITDVLEKLADFLNGNTSFSDFMDSLTQGETLVIAFVTAVIGFKTVTAILTGFHAVSALASAAISSIGTAAAGAAGQLTTFSGIAPLFAQAALAIGDALLLAYDYKALKETSKTYGDAQKAHNEETKTALEQFEQLYREQGPEIAAEWAKTVYQIDTTGKSLEEAQAALAKKVDSLWDGVPQGMWEGFKQGWAHYFGENGAGLSALLGDTFTTAVTFVKENVLKEHSPSVVFDNMGQNSALGYIQGFKRRWPELTAFFSAAFSGLKAGFANAWADIKTGADTAWSDIKTDLSGAWSAISHTAKTTWDSFQKNSSSAWTGIKTDLSQKAAAVKTEVSAKLSELATSAKAQWAGIKSSAVSEWSNIRSSVTAAAQGTSTQVVNAFISMQSTLSGVWAGIRSAASGAMSSISSTVSSITSSISSRVASIRTTVSNMTSTASTALTKVADKMDDLTRKTASTISVGGKFANGGIIYDGGRMRSWYDTVAKYAAGTARAMGSVFVAGEAGPEIVGHVNGRTEVLNQSQIASVIREAFTGALNAATQSFGGWLSNQLAANTNALIASISQIQAISQPQDPDMVERITALQSVPYQVPAYATGTVMPYEIVAEIQKQTSELKTAIYDNGQIIIGAVVSAISNHGLSLQDAIRNIPINQTRGLTPEQQAKYTIDAINRQTRMMGKSPILT